MSSERVLEYLRTLREVPDNVRKAVVEYLKATWNVYLVSMQQDVAGDHQQVCEVFREKFVTVRKILDVSETVKVHIMIKHLSQYMENCDSTFAWTLDEFIKSIHSKLRRFEDNHSYAVRKKRKLGSDKHLERLLTSIGLFNYENLGNFFNNSVDC